MDYQVGTQKKRRQCKIFNGCVMFFRFVSNLMRKLRTKFLFIVPEWFLDGAVGVVGVDDDVDVAIVVDTAVGVVYWVRFVGRLAACQSNGPFRSQCYGVELALFCRIQSTKFWSGARCWRSRADQKLNSTCGWSAAWTNCVSYTARQSYPRISICAGWIEVKTKAAHDSCHGGTNNHTTPSRWA